MNQTTAYRPLRSVFFFGIFFFSSLACSSPVERELKFNDLYIPPVVSGTNQSANQANLQLKEVMKGQSVSIPSGWRLVNVVPKGADFVLFFQAQDGAVYSFGVSSNGSLTGHDALHIPSHR